MYIFDKGTVQSIKTSLSYLSQPDYAELVSLAIQVNLQLIDLLTPPPSSIQSISIDRFNSLSLLLKEGPLAIWTFAPEKVAFAYLAAAATVAVTDRLGIGMMRHLQDVLHPLLATLQFPLPPATDAAVQLYIKTAVAVQRLVECCSVGMSRWRNVVLCSVARCWLQIVEEPKCALVEGTAMLLKELQAVVGSLVRALGDDVLVSANSVWINDC